MSSLAGVLAEKCLAMNIPVMPGVYDLFAAALGIGLLTGAELERRKGRVRRAPRPVSGRS